MVDSAQTHRRSARDGAGTHPRNKRANSTTQEIALRGLELLQQQQAKKPRRRAPTITIRSSLLFVSQEEEQGGTEIAEDIEDTENTEDAEDAEDVENNTQDNEQDLEGENNELLIEEKQLEEEPIIIPSWLGTWKAVVNKKIDLSSSQGGK